MSDHNVFDNGDANPSENPELEEAKRLLHGTIRNELRDHAFSDVEITWTRNGEIIAEGYFGGGTASVWLSDDQTRTQHYFDDDEAKQLRDVGTVGMIHRNDEQGPDLAYGGP